MEDNKKENEEIQSEAFENEADLSESCDDQAQETEELSEEESLRSELEKAQNTVKELNDRLLRNMAEFDNFRKRTLSEKAAMYDNGVKDSVEKLLPVIDSFERAVAGLSDEDRQNNVYKGVEMILRQFMDTLSDMGVEEIPAEDQDFDPNLHNAVMHIEDESFGENKVAEVLQKGYKYNDKVIRPSMVKVAN